MEYGKWHKSSRSADAGQCVEVRTGQGAQVRDTKDRDGGTLTFGPAAWRSFVRGVRSGDLDA